MARRTTLRNPKMELLIDFLVDPIPSASTPTQKAWAEQNGVAPQTAANWKGEPEFRAAWEKRLAQLNVSPDRTQAVVNAMFKRAEGGDTTAAKLYLEYVRQFQRPPEVDATVAAAELDDDELELLIAEAARAEVERRAPDEL